MEGPWCHPPEADGKPQNRLRWRQPEESQFHKDHLGCNAENEQSEDTPGGEEAS